MNEYAITSTKRRGNQIKIVLKSIARPTAKKGATVKKMLRHEASPMLAFFSGPGFESRELELDLRDLVGINVNDLDDSLRDIMVDDPKESLVDGDDVDNESIVSEISTCSSVVTVTLEPVDEEPKVLTKQKPPASPASSKNSEPWSCPSSSEAEEEHESKKSGRKSKKISNLFSFNSGSSTSSASIHPVGPGENQTDRSSAPIDRKKNRRPSLTRRMSPLAFSIFSAGTTLHNPADLVKQDLVGFEKDTKKSAQGQGKNRKLSLTKFQKQGSSEKLDGRKRRNTDPNLLQKQRTSSIVETELDCLKLGEGEEAGSPERVRKVSFNTLAPVEEPKKDDFRLIEPEKGDFKDEDIKLRNLIGDVLRSHMLSMIDYRKETCDRTGKSISKILKTLIESMKQSEGSPCKVVCIVYMGAVRDQGIFMSTQALWDSNQDNFAAASFRNEAIFGLAVVIATPYV